MFSRSADQGQPRARASNYNKVSVSTFSTDSRDTSVSGSSRFVSGSSRVHTHNMLHNTNNNNNNNNNNNKSTGSGLRTDDGADAGGSDDGDGWDNSKLATTRDSLHALESDAGSEYGEGEGKGEDVDDYDYEDDDEEESQSGLSSSSYSESYSETGSERGDVGDVGYSYNPGHGLTEALLAESSLSLRDGSSSSSISSNRNRDSEGQGQGQGTGIGPGTGYGQGQGQGQLGGHNSHNSYNHNHGHGYRGSNPMTIQTQNSNNNDNDNDNGNDNDNDMITNNDDNRLSLTSLTLDQAFPISPDSSVNSDLGALGRERERFSEASVLSRGSLVLLSGASTGGPVSGPGLGLGSNRGSLASMDGGSCIGGGAGGRGGGAASALYDVYHNNSGDKGGTNGGGVEVNVAGSILSRTSTSAGESYDALRELPHLPHLDRQSSDTSDTSGSPRPERSRSGRAPSIESMPETVSLSGSSRQSSDEFASSPVNSNNNNTNNSNSNSNSNNSRKKWGRLNFFSSGSGGDRGGDRNDSRGERPERSSSSSSSALGNSGSGSGIGGDRGEKEKGGDKDKDKDKKKSKKGRGSLISRTRKKMLRIVQSNEMLSQTLKYNGRSIIFVVFFCLCTAYIIPVLFEINYIDWNTFQVSLSLSLSEVYV